MKAMLDALRRGDRVVTAGGIIGTIAKVDADEVQVEIAEGVRVRVVRSTITNVLAKPEPVAAKKDAKDDEADKKIPSAARPAKAASRRSSRALSGGDAASSGAGRAERCFISRPGR